jgi:uncharacterized protein (TIGR00730 family)
MEGLKYRIGPQMTDNSATGPFPSARDEIDAGVGPEIRTAQTASPAFRLAFEDDDFLLRSDLRPIRLQLELLKPELLQQEQGIRSTIAMFGSARIPDPETAKDNLAAIEAESRAKPHDKVLARQVGIARRMLANSRYYEEARQLAQLVSKTCVGEHVCDFVVKTGGGPGIMEAANRGAHEVGGKSIGLNIVLPMEQAPNRYVTPELCFRFHYFAIRKMHFLIRVKALVVFPGGFGTLDELFEALTLIQTGKIEPIPVLMFGREYWERVINFDAMAMEGMIGPEDKDLLNFVETAEEAWNIIAEFYRLPR